MLFLFIAGKRDVVFTAMSEIHSHPSLPVLHDDIIPEPYNLGDQLKVIDRHHRRQRRMSPCCGDRYVLFILDTSGSIGPTVFADMVKNLSTLVPLFCKNTRIAAMTFGTHIYHEFCFNCFYNDHFSNKLKEALSSIPYHGGGTHAGRALKCACDEILTTACGLPSEQDYKECPAPIDVVVLTDGHTNGPLDVCETAKCLHGHTVYDINTFAIAVNTFDQDKLKCIANQNNPDDDNIFYIDTFEELSTLIGEIIDYLSNPGPGGVYPICYNPN